MAYRYPFVTFNRGLSLHPRVKHVIMELPKHKPKDQTMAYTRPAAISLPAPLPRGLVATRDEYGSGTADSGQTYVTFRISRPDTDSRFGATLADIVIYSGDTHALVWDRYTGDARQGDLSAIARLRDWIGAHLPDAQHAGYRYL